MSKTVELSVAHATLGELIAGLLPDEELLIVENQKPLARVVLSKESKSPRQPGNCRGMISLSIEDNEHLLDFEECSQIPPTSGSRRDRPR